MAKREKTYTAMPEVPEELVLRYRVMLEVLSGARTVSDGARQLGLSRNHFQTLMHQGLAGLIEGLTPRAPGPSPRSETERRLLEENEQLRRQNERLSERVEGIERMLGVASQLLRSGRSLTARAPRSRKAGKKSDEEPPERRLEHARRARAMGLTALLTAALLGASVATLRRWRAREGRAEPLVRRRGPASALPLSPAVALEVEDRVRRLGGLVGAEALRRMVPGVSRRQAASVKKRTLTAMENERIEGLCRVVVTQAGVLRGFDAMHVTTTEGPRFLLAAGDASVPYRTSATAVDRYDGPAVASTLAADFARHGAPLVLRADRAKAHETPEVQQVLRDHGVLLLHGPPRFPRYYGQLERQNREHRGWLTALGLASATGLDEHCAEMLAALNGLWKRPTLDWRTAEELWLERPRLELDRAALRDEVVERTERIQRSMKVPSVVKDLAWRLAIEHTLTKKGLLRREAGGWC